MYKSKVVVIAEDRMMVVVADSLSRLTLTLPARDTTVTTLLDVTERNDQRSTAQPATSPCSPRSSFFFPPTFISLPLHFLLPVLRLRQT